MILLYVKKPESRWKLPRLSAKTSGLIELSSWAFTSAPGATTVLKVKESERNLLLPPFYFSFGNKDLPKTSLMDSDMYLELESS